VLDNGQPIEGWGRGGEKRTQLGVPYFNGPAAEKVLVLTWLGEVVEVSIAGMG